MWIDWSFLLYLACFVFIYSKYLVGSIIDPYLLGIHFSLGWSICIYFIVSIVKLIPKSSGTILALITGAFDASSAVFLLYRIGYNASLGSFTLEKFFTLYLFVPTFIAVVQIFIMNSDSYQTEGTSKLCANDEETMDMLHLLYLPMIRNHTITQ